jgi:hypothetical protein
LFQDVTNAKAVISKEEDCIQLNTNDSGNICLRAYNSREISAEVTSSPFQGTGYLSKPLFLQASELLNVLDNFKGLDTIEITTWEDQKLVQISSGSSNTQYHLLTLLTA